MWCRVCEVETTDEICSVCGYPTISENLGSVDLTDVHFCGGCNTPVIFRADDSVWNCFKRFGKKNGVKNV